MKLSLLIASTAYAVAALAACPFAEFRRTLSEEDNAKFEAVRRDPKAAEALLKEYQAQKRQEAHQALKREAAPAPDPDPYQSSVIGPRQLGGLLDLPLGGGLRECIPHRSSADGIN